MATKIREMDEYRMIKKNDVMTKEAVHIILFVLDNDQTQIYNGIE